MKGIGTISKKSVCKETKRIVVQEPYCTRQHKARQAIGAAPTTHFIRSLFGFLRGKQR